MAVVVVVYDAGGVREEEEEIHLRSPTGVYAMWEPLLGD